MNVQSQVSDTTVNFLLCSERSGSNLIRVMLDSHSQIFSPGPTHIGRIFIPKLKQYGDLNTDANFRKLTEDVIAFYNRKFSHSTYSVTAEEVIEKVPHRSFFAVYEYIYKKGMLLSEKSQIFIKENHNHQFAADWLSYYPNAKFVFQVRDPRDFYLSAKKYRPFLTMYHSPCRTLNTWQKDQEESLRLFLELGSDRVFFLRYEDLISNPEEVLTRLCAFLGVPFESRMLEFHKNESAIKDSASKSAWQNLSKSLLKDNKEKFRKGLSRTEIIRIEHRLGAFLRIFGYRPSYENVPAWLLGWSLFVESIREVLANLYRVTRDSYRRLRDIALKLIGK